MIRFPEKLRAVWLLILASMGWFGFGALAEAPSANPQYSYGEITLPAASEEEPLRESFSPDAAVEYLDQGAVA